MCPSSVYRARVLLVDDEAAILSCFARILRREGFEVITAEDAAGAEAVLAEHAVDVVLSDYLMPGGDGLFLFDRLRARGLSVPLLLMTGTPSQEIEAHAATLDVEAILTKPIERSTLLTAVTDAQRIPRRAVRHFAPSESPSRAAHAVARPVHHSER